MTVPLPFRIVGLQVIAVVAAALLMLFEGTRQAGSAVLGGTVIVLPNAYFAYAVARRLRLEHDSHGHHDAGDGNLAAMRLLGRGASKLVLAAVLMGLVFSFVRVEPLGFFGAMTVALLVQVLAPFLAGVLDQRGRPPGEGGEQR